MADVLSSGPDRGPGPGRGGAGPGPDGPHRRVPTWLGRTVLIVVGVAVAVPALRSGVDGSTDGQPGPTPTSTVEPAPPPTRLLHPPARYRLDGTPGAGPAGLRVAIGGRSVGVLDTATGRLTSLPGIRVVPDANASLTRTATGLGVSVYSPTRGGVTVFLPDSGGPAQLGESAYLVPARDGTVLRVQCSPADAQSCRLASVTPRGVVRWQRELAPGSAVVRDTPSGLLTVLDRRDVNGLRVLQLEDARTGSVRRRFGLFSQVLAATERAVAALPPGCDDTCTLLVRDFDGGPLQRYEIPFGRIYHAEFSPDGTRLALGYGGMLEQDPSVLSDRDGFAVVLDLDSRDVQRVPGLTTGPKTAPLPAWTPDGLLVLATGNDGVGRIALWRPGARQVTVLPRRLENYYPHPGSLLVLP